MGRALTWRPLPPSSPLLAPPRPPPSLFLRLLSVNRPRATGADTDDRVLVVASGEPEILNPPSSSSSFRAVVR
jgi:hypothetical protein